MPEALLDTSIVVDYLRGRGEAMGFVAAQRQHGELSVHAVVEAEIIAGALDRRDLRGANRFLSTCTRVIPDESDLRRSLVLLARHRLASGVEWHDCIIAATALRTGISVATFNQKHFRVFRGLRVIVPY